MERCRAEVQLCHCGLTPRSRRAPTAWHTGRQALGLRPILRLPSSVPRCRCRLSSNVRRRRNAQSRGRSGHRCLPALRISVQGLLLCISLPYRPTKLFKLCEDRRAQAGSSSTVACTSSAVRPLQSGVLITCNRCPASGLAGTKQEGEVKMVGTLRLQPLRLRHVRSPM